MTNSISAIAPQQTALLPVAQLSSSKTRNTFLEIIQSKKVRQAANNWSQWGAAGFNIITFANANFNFLDQFKDGLENLTKVITKAAYIVSSAAGAVDLWYKKNPFPFVGFTSGIPLTVLSSSYNLFLAYGIPYGLGNFSIITDQREVVDKDGEPIPDEAGNVQLVNGDFGDRGWMNALKTTLVESGKIIRELIQKPTRIKKISHALFASSVFEMFGPIVGYFGFEKLGSFIRSSGTIATQTAFLLHNDSSKKSSVEEHGKVTLKSSIAIGGVLGILGSAVDFIKRLGFISDKIEGLTNLSLALDRGMGALVVSGIIDIENSKQEQKSN